MVGTRAANSCPSNRSRISIATMMYAHVLPAFFLSSMVTMTSAFLQGGTVPLHGHFVGVDTKVLYNTYPSLSQRKICSNSQPFFQRKMRILASATSDDDTTATEHDNEEEEITGVTLKMAFDSSIPWAVADLSETKSERFTSSDSLDMVHRLRRESSAVLVGRGTVERDDCTLTVRRVELGDGQSQPVRVVIDPSLSLLDGDYTLLKDGLPTIIYHQSKISKATSDHVTLVELGQSDFGDGSRSSMSPSQVLKDLAARGLKHIMVEGGPATALAFLEARSVDRAIIVRAPIEFEIPVPARIDEHTLKSAGLQLIGTAMMGGDNVEYWTRNGSPWPNSSMWP